MQQAKEPHFRDTKTVQDVLHFGTVCFLSSPPQKTVGRKTFLGLLTVLSHSVSVYCMYGRWTVMRKHDLSEVLIFTACVTAIPAWFLWSYCLWSSYFGGEHQEVYHKLDRDIETTLRQIGFEVEPDWTVKYLSVGLKVCLAGFVLHLIGEPLYRFLEGWLYVYTVNAYPENVAMLILIYVTALVKAVARCMEGRYKFLAQSLRNTPSLTVFRIRTLEKLTRLLYQQSSSANEMFKVSIFLGVVFAVIGCLSSISFLLTAGKTGFLSSFVYVHISLSCASRLLCIAIITLSLDGVTVAAGHFSKLVNKSIVTNQNPHIVEELRFSAIYAEELIPIFTAWCFTVDRYLLSSCLTAIASYLIVIAQFSNVNPVNISEPS